MAIARANVATMLHQERKWFLNLTIVTVLLAFQRFGRAALRATLAMLAKHAPSCVTD
jgi:hypothetical protein